MNKKDFINTITYLGLAYNKNFTDQEMLVWYDMLGEYPEEVLNKSIKDLVSREKYMPKISDVIEECKKYKKLDRYEVLERLRAKNYFKDGSEYLKAKQWLEEGIMPEWFKEVLKEQYNILLDDNSTKYIKQDTNTTSVKYIDQGDSDYVNEE